MERIFIDIASKYNFFDLFWHDPFNDSTKALNAPVSSFTAFPQAFGLIVFLLTLRMGDEE